jgi:hypothetical protein
MEIISIPLCRHIKTNGLNCRAAALTDSAFCRHHQKLHRTRRKTISSGPGLSTNVLHPLRNAGSIQDAISMVYSGLFTGQIPTKKAGQMLHALQMLISSRK